MDQFKVFSIKKEKKLVNHFNKECIEKLNREAEEREMQQFEDYQNRRFF